MKKLLLLISVLAFGLTAMAETSTTWNFSDEGWAGGVTKDGLTLGSDVVVDAHSKSIDGYSFTSRAKLGGAISATKNVSFSVTGACSIKVYGMSGKSGNSRELIVRSGSATADNLATFGTNDGTAIGGYTYDYTGGAATLYIGATNGYNLYAIIVTYADADPEAPTIESIVINGELTAETFYEGADMDYSGLSVEGTYSNDSTATLTSGITWSIAPALAEGTNSYTITAAVGELTATKNVTLTVSAVVLSQIKIEGYLHTPAYYTGSTLSLSGLQVNAYYSDNSKVDVTSQAGLTADVTTLTETVDVNFSAAFEGKTATKELNVYVCDPASAGATVLLSYDHAAALPTGVLVGGTTALGKAKMNVNKNEYDVIQLKNGYTKDNAYNGNSIKLVVDGGFQAGDEIIVSAYYNNSTEFKEAQVTLFTLNEDNSVHTLQTMGQAINGRYMAATPFECVYVLESAIADTLYIGRSGGTTLGVYTIKVQRPAVELTPFQQALKAIEEGAAESVEFTAILVSVSGTNYVVKEETTAVANPAPMKRIAAEDAEPTITLINPTVLNSAGNEPTEAGTRVAITGTTDATGIINGTIKAVNEKGWATGVDNTEAQKVEKIFRNGQVVIIKNGVEYNVLGAKL